MYGGLNLHPLVPTFLKKAGVVACAYNPGTGRAEAGTSLELASMSHSVRAIILKNKVESSKD